MVHKVFFFIWAAAKVAQGVYNESCTVEKKDSDDSCSFQSRTRVHVQNQRHQVNRRFNREAPPTACVTPKTQSQCKKVAEKMAGLQWDGTRNWSNRLPGCLRTVSDGDVNWNKNEAGKDTGVDQVPLCMNACDEKPEHTLNITTWDGGVLQVQSAVVDVATCEVATAQIWSEDETCISIVGESTSELVLNGCGGRVVLKVPKPVSELHVTGNAKVHAMGIKGTGDYLPNITVFNSTVFVETVESEGEFTTLVDGGFLRLDNLHIDSNHYIDNLKADTTFDGTASNHLFSMHVQKQHFDVDCDGCRELYMTKFNMPGLSFEELKTNSSWTNPLEDCETDCTGRFYLGFEKTHGNGELRVYCNDCYELGTNKLTMFGFQIEESHLSPSSFRREDPDDPHVLESKLVVTTPESSQPGNKSHFGMDCDGACKWLIKTAQLPDFAMEHFQLNHFGDFDFLIETNSGVNGKLRGDFDLFAEDGYLNHGGGNWTVRKLNMSDLYIEDFEVIHELSGIHVDTDFDIAIETGGQTVSRWHQDYDVFGEACQGCSGHFAMGKMSMSDLYVEDFEIIHNESGSFAGTDFDMVVDTDGQTVSKWYQDYDTFAEACQGCSGHFAMGKMNTHGFNVDNFNVSFTAQGDGESDLDTDFQVGAGADDPIWRMDFDSFGQAAPPEHFDQPEFGTEACVTIGKYRMQDAGLQYEDFEISSKFDVGSPDGLCAVDGDWSLQLGVPDPAGPRLIRWRSDIDAWNQHADNCESRMTVGSVQASSFDIKNLTTTNKQSAFGNMDTDFAWDVSDGLTTRMRADGHFSADPGSINTGAMNVGYMSMPALQATNLGGLVDLSNDVSVESFSDFEIALDTSDEAGSMAMDCAGMTFTIDEYAMPNFRFDELAINTTEPIGVSYLGMSVDTDDLHMVAHGEECDQFNVTGLNIESNDVPDINLSGNFTFSYPPGSNHSGNLSLLGNRNRHNQKYKKDRGSDIEKLKARHKKALSERRQTRAEGLNGNKKRLRHLPRGLKLNKFDVPQSAKRTYGFQPKLA